MIVFFCAWRFLNFVTENYPSYHPYLKLLHIGPGLYNFVRRFRRAYEPGKVAYNCTKKSVANTSYVTVLIKILFEFTLFNLQNAVKIDSLSILARRGLIPRFICFFFDRRTPLQRWIYNWEAYKCVCGVGGRGRGL